MLRSKKDTERVWHSRQSESGLVSCTVLQAGCVTITSFAFREPGCLWPSVNFKYLPLRRVGRGDSLAEKPLDVIHKALDSNVIVELKGSREFRGKLVGYDIHMNLVLEEAEELNNGEAIRSLGHVVVRGDNVVLISPTIR
jgi:small nuclear ribonucleoprotein